MMKIPQSSLMLRLLGGGYLVYLAWDIVKGGSIGMNLPTAAAALFAVVGAVLFVASAVTLVRDNANLSNPVAEAEETRDPDEA